VWQEHKTRTNEQSCHDNPREKWQWLGVVTAQLEDEF
jgi:hypothetical protein